MSSVICIESLNKIGKEKKKKLTKAKIQNVCFIS